MSMQHSKRLLLIVKKTAKGWLHVTQFFIIIATAVSIAVLMMVLSILPPFSIIYTWLICNRLTSVWNGVTSGILSVLFTDKCKLLLL